MLTSLASTTKVVMISAIPLIVHDERLIASSFGIWKGFVNSGDIIVNVLIGRVQDITIGNVSESNF